MSTHSWPGSDSRCPKLTGRLWIELAERRGRTEIESLVEEGEFRLSRPVYGVGPDPQLYLIHVGGGCVEGDAYELTVVCESGSRAVLTTQSATKVYKSPVRPVTQSLAIELAPGGCLDFRPDVIIPYENARYHQRTHVRMSSSSRLLYSEILTPGWSADGGWFRYSEFRSWLTVWVDDRPVLYDHQWLCPDNTFLGLGQMEGYTHYGTLLVMGYELSHPTHNVLAESVQGLGIQGCVGLSPLPGPGFMVRVFGLSTDEVEQVFHVVRGRIWREWFGATPQLLRKY
ncbi:urease accessory protein UreD [Alicyclobacillus shizuokensis]|uniref:urease accessory protein UreD n=1 Tax=Alicyclobacillus shizuokensis TaxID=392014 RepID=UPI00083030F8|nr:urease accessory protein UreD [Alicyclobacillus shizuokensis]